MLCSSFLRRQEGSFPVSLVRLQRYCPLKFIDIFKFLYAVIKGVPKPAFLLLLLYNKRHILFALWRYFYFNVEYEYGGYVWSIRFDKRLPRLCCQTLTPLTKFSTPFCHDCCWITHRISFLSCGTVYGLFGYIFPFRNNQKKNSLLALDKTPRKLRLQKFHCFGRILPTSFWDRWLRQRKIHIT